MPIHTEPHGQTELLTNLSMSRPSWPNEGSRHDVLKLKVTKDVASLAVDEVVDSMSTSWPGRIVNIENSNAGKKCGGEDVVYFEDDLSKGAVYEHEGRTISRRSSRWLSDEAQERALNEGAYPRDTLIQSPVVHRSLVEERQRLSPSGVPLASVGFETELSVFDKKHCQKVNITELVDALGGDFSAEGHVSQLEMVSRPCLKNGRNRFSYRFLQIARHEVLLQKVLDSLGLEGVILGVMPGTTDGEPNLDYTHVSKVVNLTFAEALDRDSIDTEEGAELLSKYIVNGLHLTASLAPDDEGRIGDEMMKQVFDKTHTSASVLMAAITQSGNLGSAEDLASGTLSFRDKHRSVLPTARVGQVLPLLDDRVVESFKNGRSNSLERASLCDEKGNPCKGAHNVLGRQKDAGRNEITVFDAEPHSIKVAHLESWWVLLTASTQRALLRSEDDPHSFAQVTSQLSPGRRELFTEALTNQDRFLELSAQVSANGVHGMIEVDGQQETIGQLLSEYLAWTKHLAVSQGFEQEEAGAEVLSSCDVLINIVQNMLNNSDSDTFEDYFDCPDNPKCGLGSVSRIAKKRFAALQGGELSDEEVYDIIYREYNTARHRYVEMLEDIHTNGK